MRPETERAIFQQGGLTFNRKCYAILEETEKTFTDDEHAVYATRTNLTVETIGVRKKGMYPGAMVCFTDRRLLARRKDGASVDMMELEYKDIRSVSMRQGGSHNHYIDLMDDARRYEVLMPHDQADRKHMYKLVHDAIEACIQAERYNRDEPNPSDVLSQIEKLAEMHDKGILTEEEYNSKKAKLLARL